MGTYFVHFLFENSLKVNQSHTSVTYGPSAPGLHAVNALAGLTKLFLPRPPLLLLADALRLLLLRQPFLPRPPLLLLAGALGEAAGLLQEYVVTSTPAASNQAGFV